MQKSPRDRIRARARETLIRGPDDLGLGPARLVPEPDHPAGVLAIWKDPEAPAEPVCLAAARVVAALRESGTGSAALQIAVARFFATSAAEGHDDQMVASHLVALGLGPRYAADLLGQILAEIGAAIMDS